MRKGVLGIGLAILLLIISSCGTDPEVQLAEFSRNTVVYDEIVHLNNCGGKGDSDHTATREFATTIDIAGGVSLKSVVEGTISAKYSEYRNTSKSLRVVAPPGTNMEFVLRWSDDVRAGNVQVNGKSGTYEVRIPVSVEQISSRDLGCITSSFSTAQPTPSIYQPVNPPSVTRSAEQIPKTPEEAANLFGGPSPRYWTICPGEVNCWTFSLPGKSFRVTVPENCLRADGSIDGWRYGGGYPGPPDSVQGSFRIWNALEAATIRCK